MKKSCHAFSLVELSFVIFIVGLLIAGVAQTSKMIRKTAVASAQSQTKQSVVNDMSDVVLWYESTLDKSFVEDEMVDGGGISTWYDNNAQSLSRTNASQTTINNRPTYNESAINKLPALQFSGTKYFAINDNPCTQSFTVFMVFQTSTVAGTSSSAAPLLWSDAASASNDISPLIITTSNVAMSNGGTTSDYWLTLTGKTVTNNFPHIVTISRHMDSGTRNIWLDGTNNVSDTNVRALINLNANMNLLIGGNTINNVYFNGLIGEIIFFNRSLLTDERKAVEKYLSKKWKIDFS